MIWRLSTSSRLSLGVAAGLAVAVSLAALPAAANSSHVEVIVFLDVPTSEARQAAHQTARQHRGDIAHIYEHAQPGFSATVPAGRLNGLRAHPDVIMVAVDEPVVAASLPTGIQRIFADHNDSIPTGATYLAVDADIAVLDTGIDADHPDLNVVASVDCTRAYIDGSCRDGGDRDAHGHGTYVAGAAAARDTGTPAVGVAAGARLHAVKVLDDNGAGWTSNIVAGIDWVTANAHTIDVANLSLRGSSSDPYELPLARSVDAGVAYAVAAGNDSADISQFAPAGHPDVLTVSALADFDGQPGGTAAPTCRPDTDDTLADFSNYGAGDQSIDVIAPGVCLATTQAGGDYATQSGTSMAAPHVAGAAALLASTFDRPLDRDDVDGIYQTIVEHGNDGWDATSDPDGVQEPLLDVSSDVFAPTVVDDPDPEPPLRQLLRRLIGM